MRTKLLLMVVYAFAGAVLAGCPPPEGWPKPPFDTTGDYAGVWRGQTTTPEKQQEIPECPLTMTLTQDVNLDYPADHSVSGTVVIDYSCVELPAWAQQTLPASVVNVSGLLADDGKLTLLSGGCGPGICVVLTIAGEGADADADGFMDTYEGAWSFVILLAGVQPFGVSGTFEVAATDTGS